MRLQFKEENTRYKQEIIDNGEYSVVEEALQAVLDSEAITEDVHRARVSVLNKSNKDLMQMYARILMVLRRQQRMMPIQEMAGAVAKAMYINDLDVNTVIDCCEVAADLIVNTDELFDRRVTENGHLMCKSLLYDPKAQESELFALPLHKPSKKTRELGAYKWHNTNNEALKILNKVELTLIDIPEAEMKEPAVYATEDEKEKFVKYIVRNETKENFIGKPMFFKWSSDYRGRMYSSGYHYNIQGNEYEKNVIAFNKFDYSTKRAIYQVKLALAVAFGKDKVIDEEKIEWYDEFIKITDNKLKLLSDESPKHPTEFEAQCRSMTMLLTDGITNIPIEKDATNSQLQIVSVLMGCQTTAMTCNVITDNAEIQDGYKLLAEEMTLETGISLGRGQIKYSMMIDGYGGGAKKIEQQLTEDIANEKYRKKGNAREYDDRLLPAFYESKDVIAPASGIIKNLFMDIWDNERTEYKWTLPDGFVADLRPVETINISLNPYGLKEISMIAKAVYKTNRNTKLGVSIIHSIDGYIARQMIILCKALGFDVLPIHDGFRCLPNFVDDMQKVYVGILADIADSTLLEDIVEEITGERITAHKDFTGAQVKLSKYALS